MKTIKQRGNATGLSRRAVVGGLLGSTALSFSQAFAAKPPVRAFVSLPRPKAGGNPFINPNGIVAAADGSYTLEMAERQAILGLQHLKVQAYIDPNNPADTGSKAALNRPICGPTITLTGNGSPVQNVTVHLQNHLPVLPASHHSHGVGATTDENPHGFNVTNLHTHGLHVAPDQDNVYVTLCPAGSLDCNSESMRPTNLQNACQPAVVATGDYTYQYSFGQTPGGGTTSLPAGTYWYHPHKHGSVASQVANGLAGAIIVRGDLDAIPGVAGLTEQVMVAQIIQYTPVSGPDIETSVNPAYVYGTQNPPSPLNAQISLSGQINPLFALQAGEIQRWRFINATDCDYFYLTVQPTGGTTAPAPVIYAIATDGIALTNVPGTMTVPFNINGVVATPSNQAEAILNEVAVMAPAQRLDLLVQTSTVASTSPQTYDIVAMPWPVPSPAVAGQVIATIEVKGAKATADVMPAASAFNAGALYRPPITMPANPNLPNPTPTQYIDFSFAPQNDGLSSVNLTQFDPTKPQINLNLNAVDIWGVQGYQGPHAFHIHINSFVMYQRDNYTFAPAVIWRDTARIDNKDATNGPTSGPPSTPWPTPTTYFVSQQLDYRGEFVLHCHVLMHEDFGMMWSVAVGCEQALVKEKGKGKDKKKPKP